MYAKIAVTCLFIARNVKKKTLDYKLFFKDNDEN